MKKFITTLCLIFSMMFAFSAIGCGGSSWKVNYTKGTVDSNGGFAVEIVSQTEAYTYFINGLADSSANNKFGTPVQGSLVRVKTSELSKGADATSAEVVVPKLFASSFYGTDVGYKSGLTIFGDYVYYGTPNTDTDKKGNVKNSEIVFQKTKLDGTSTSEIATFSTLGVEYRYTQSNGKVYLTIVERVEGTSSDGSSTTATYNIFVYGEDGTKLFEKQAADTLILPYEFDVNSDYLFFTDLEKDEEEQDKKYSNIYAYKFGDEKETVLLSGKSSFYGGADEFGVQGRTYIVDKFINNVLFFSYLSADTNDGDVRQYSFLDIKAKDVKTIDLLKEDATEAEKEDYQAKFNAQNTKNLEAVKPMGGTSNVVKSVLPTALYKFDQNDKLTFDIVYFDSARGIVSFNYKEREVSPYYGISVLVEISKIDIETPKFMSFVDDYAYFTDASSYVYRIKYKNIAADEVVEMEQISTVAIKTDWYFFEVIGGNLLACVSGEPYNNYIHAFDLDIEADAEAYFVEELKDANSDASKAKEEGELVELYLKEIADKEDKAIKYTAGKRVGVLKSADKEAVENYISALNSSVSSSSSN